jgi:hypothetical protein
MCKINDPKHTYDEYLILFTKSGITKNDQLQRSKAELDDFISEIQLEKMQLLERLSASLKESSITSKCLEEVQQNIAVLSSNIDYHVSANKVLEKK